MNKYPRILIALTMTLILPTRKGKAETSSSKPMLTEGKMQEPNTRVSKP